MEFSLCMCVCVCVCVCGTIYISVCVRQSRKNKIMIRQEYDQSKIKIVLSSQTSV